MLLATMCESVSAYGFSGDECRKMGCHRPYHYFSSAVESQWLRAHPSHSFELEGVVLRAMHAHGHVCVGGGKPGCGWLRELGQRAEVPLLSTTRSSA